MIPQVSARSPIKLNGKSREGKLPRLDRDIKTEETSGLYIRVRKSRTLVARRCGKTKMILINRHI